MNYLTKALEKSGGASALPAELRNGLATQFRIYASLGCAEAQPLLSLLAVEDQAEAKPLPFGRMRTQQSADLAEQPPRPSLPEENAGDLLRKVLSRDPTQAAHISGATPLRHLAACSLPPASSEFPLAICMALTQILPELLAAPPEDSASVLGIASSVVSFLFAHPLGRDGGPLQEALTQLVHTAIQLRRHRSSQLVSLIMEYSKLLGARFPPAPPEPACYMETYPTLIGLRSIRTRRHEIKTDPALISSVLANGPQLWIGEEVIERVMLHQVSATGKPGSVIDIVLPLLSHATTPSSALGLLLDWLEAADPTGRTLPKRWLLSSNRATQLSSVKNYVVWLLINSASWTRLHDYFHSTLHSASRPTVRQPLLFFFRFRKTKQVLIRLRIRAMDANTCLTS